MRTIPSQFMAGLRELNRISTVLLLDLGRSVDQLMEAYKLAVGAPSEHARARWNYRVKTVIRCLLATVDGVSYILRQTVLDCAPKMGMGLDENERRLLRKVRNPRASLEHGYKYFARLAGLNLQIDTSSKEWKAFDELVEVRHAMSHPGDIRDLYALSGFHALKPSLVWCTNLMRELFGELGTAFGLQPPTLRETNLDVEESVLRERLFGTFDPEFFDLVARDAGRSICYLGHCFGVLNKETTLAIEELSGFSSVWDPRRQYQARLLAWSSSSNIEGVTNLLRIELGSAVDRGELQLSDADRKTMAAECVEDRAVATATVWSREVGYDSVPAQRGEHWTAVAQARGIRNRISHPKKVNDLRLDPTQQRALLRASRWFTSELLPALRIHPEKWLDKLDAT